jgi:hypothetical protein
MRLKQPAGRPASANARAIAQYEQGDSSEDFRTVVLPAASAQAADRMPNTYGAFLCHGSC